MLRKLSRLLPKKYRNHLHTKLLQIRTHPLTFRKKQFQPQSETRSQFITYPLLENPLTQLGEKYQPTKRLHNYLVHYWRHFQEVHTKVTRVLEIGVQSDKSIKMWEEFFPNAVIYGIDIEPACKDFSGGRRKVFVGDQSDEKLLDQVVADAGGFFDIIIDDGSHRVFHQLKSFDVLFPKLSSHGIYVIEDTGACVGDTKLKTVNAIKNLVDNIMYYPPGHPFDRWSSLDHFPADSSWADRNIVGISFYRWICFIEKGNNPGDNPYLKT